MNKMPFFLHVCLCWAMLKENEWLHFVMSQAQAFLAMEDLEANI